MRHLRPRRPAAPYVPPSDAPSLAEVVRELAVKPKIPVLDHEVFTKLRIVERQLQARGLRRIVRAKIADGVELAWSQNKHRQWRFVVRDDEEAVDLYNLEPEERLEIITSGALERLVKEAATCLQTAATSR